MTTYDKYYLKKKYFGSPYKELLYFFKNYPKRGSLIDLGAGQGRDSIPLSNMGYKVTAVDISSVGLEQIKEQNSDIDIIKHDIYNISVMNYDYILLDSMLHFYKKDEVKERKFVSKIIEEMKPGAVFVSCFARSKKAEKILLDIIESSQYEFKYIENRYFDWPEWKCEYHLLIIQKNKKD